MPDNPPAPESRSAGDDAAPGVPTDPTALLIDFGGVLTSGVFASFSAACVAEGLEPDRFLQAIRGTPEAGGLFTAVERGELADDEFERAFAPMLGPDVRPEGLLRRLTAALRPDEPMLAAVRDLRAAGVTTLLLSNSFGMHAYDDYDLPGLFDHVVLSGDVGVRKPSGAIYRLALERAAVTADRAVFVDDLEQNVVAAGRAGIHGVLHVEAATTIPALEAAFGVPLGAG
ncbi:HAD family phosphatase [Patulibacter sp.]|uniref:HAD family hydrolase n=1 Tax=Patulibacter sp. TaxID=1912859 RepID=UPI0027266B99|nr:HAD family phosphatase [Patulibacter sp.]MDO9410832.1 HAD family phosphatase [Patulibacter sp.]